MADLTNTSERSVTFFGGAGTVTGSKHRLNLDSCHILLDCGTFQGLPAARERNRQFPFPAKAIDAVIISHAHLDHCGLLPLLVKKGFSGPIIATPPTIEIIRYMLEDAAQIEVQDAAYRAEHRLGQSAEWEPLFTSEDVGPVLKRFEPVSYGQWHTLLPEVEVKLYDAGHILGSAVSVVRWPQGSLGYSGDLGPLGQPLLRDPQIPEEEIPALILESTYGSRLHQPLSQAVERLAEVINHTCQQKGKIIVPAFALGRIQTLVYILHKLTDEGKIPRFPIYVDSPLAERLTQVFRTFVEDYDQATARDFPGHRPLDFKNLRYTQSVEESKALNTERGPFMVIAASGMMSGGRIVHHLRHSVGDANNVILITGYQAEGTTGRALVEGAKTLELHGEMFSVRAKIVLCNEFSAHADRQQLQAYAEKIRGLQHVILVHGEPHQADDLRSHLQTDHPTWQVDRPDLGETVQL
jgi:metallo-beta-lactamase family protein